MGVEEARFACRVSGEVLRDAGLADLADGTALWACEVTLDAAI